MIHGNFGALNRLNRIQFARKHAKWPLGTVVQVKTKIGYITGEVFKHWRHEEVAHGCSVRFSVPVDLKGIGCEMYCHVLPFRSLKKIAYPCP